MAQASFSKWLKWIIGGIAVCGAAMYFYFLPMFGSGIAKDNPELSYCYLPWLIVIWVSAIPCFLILYFGWKIVTEIGRDNSFSMDNSRFLKYISILAFADSGYFFLANIVLLLLNMNHPAIFLATLLVEFAGVAVSVAAAALSHLVQKAADIQKENELTI